MALQLCRCVDTSTGNPHSAPAGAASDPVHTELQTPQTGPQSLPMKPPPHQPLRRSFLLQDPTATAVKVQGQMSDGGV